MIAKCKICSRDIQCLIVGDEQAKAIELGQKMLEHMGKYHMKYMQQLSQDTKCFSGFVVMNRFLIEDPVTINSIDEMREKLAEIVMEDGPLTDAEAKLEAIQEIINEDGNEDEEPEEFPDEDEEQQRTHEDTENQESDVSNPKIIDMVKVSEGN